MTTSTPTSTPAPAPSRTGAPAARRAPGTALRRAALYAALVALALVFLTPLVWMVVTSLKTYTGAQRIPPTWLPSPVSGYGYEQILNNSANPVLRWFLNSMLAATLHALLVLATASMAAYALARMRFRGRRVLFALIVGTLFVPPTSLIIPNFLIVDELNWVDTLAVVVVPGAASAFGVFFLRQFFLSLPRELEEAAVLDGAGQWQIFWKVVLPLSKPALATLAVLSFLTNWNDFLWPIFVLFSPEMLTLPPGLGLLQGAYNTDYPVIMAGAVLASVPVLILFVLAQRHIIQGVSRSGLKG
ncbi:carbohydrate ABC transporter membrane protein 2, CUT1 family [Micromonospora citrea]|uniref:Carbohydrate ABC transporter membrane protein 2, CUT1 family n=1 Tax=Micromonospora citrea TaxID=47855 RepID=A0A1C6VDC2_9ACTN|nr:carbohydrate ABC transporter permease [Micromonospora citrea]SCL63820.1 carbohydrate ABC transporter membrane protein 2, CUT1 family [Micromonospora citrea]